MPHPVRSSDEFSIEVQKDCVLIKFRETAVIWFDGRYRLPNGEVKRNFKKFVRFKSVRMKDEYNTGMVDIMTIEFENNLCLIICDLSTGFSFGIYDNSLEDPEIDEWVQKP